MWQKVAGFDGIALPCLTGQAGFYQEMILHIMPIDCPFAWTSLEHDSIPERILPNYIHSFAAQ